MKINNIGYNHCHDADFQINRPDGSGDYLLLILKTPAIFTFGEKDLTTDANSFILYQKGTPQFYRALGSSFANDWLHFDMTSEDLLSFKNYRIPFDTVIPINHINDLSMFIKNISYEHYSSNLYREESIALYLKLLFMKLSEKLHTHPDETIGTYYERMSLIRAQIYNMPYFDWNIPGMAHQLAISKSYFQHMYKQIFGTGAMDDVIQSRIHHAKYLLSTTTLSVKEISVMCGYKSETHFMRQFKACVGLTPSQYRKP
ncbi:MAG: helix-turn-helix transcriptional regulator [Lachnospiraceae bacterium]|nr:helix-turn-helix transcriptional regulator [Lachnospiraceae bacterium]